MVHINVVVPMAGRGKRFSDAGYDRPKPFIEVEPEYPMVQLVMLNLIPRLSPINMHFIFLCLSEFVTIYGTEFREKIDLICASVSYIKLSYEIVEVGQVTEGAACTVLLAEGKINNTDELIIANCDQLVLDPDYMGGSIDYYRHKKADGGVLSFLNDSPKWSYCRMAGEKINEVVEKQVVSNIATVGIYYYREGQMFVDAAKSMMSRNFRVNGEFYVAPVYNDMICRNQKVIPYMINDMVGLGTPEDLLLYQERIKCKSTI